MNPIMTRKLARGVFVTATDTGVGKTWTTIALMEALRSQGMNVAGMKPVATGCVETKNGLRSDDAIRIQVHASRSHNYTLINPYAFKPPVAPHIAAVHANLKIELSCIANSYQDLAAAADYVVVEGIGGWRVPLDRNHTLVDMVRDLGLPAVLVVGLRLGCINHALLTAETIVTDKVRLAGWVANQVDPAYTEGPRTIETLAASIPAPLLARLPFLPALDGGLLAGYFNVAHLLR